MEQWRNESKLTWPEIPKTSPKAWETFRRIIMKTFGTLRRVYNPCAEVVLIIKLVKWLDNERHSAKKIIRDINNIYIQDTKGGRKFKWSGKEGNMSTMDNGVMTSNKVIHVMGKLMRVYFLPLQIQS